MIGIKKPREKTSEVGLIEGREGGGEGGTEQNMGVDLLAECVTQL